jgi:hypothetical protein
MATDLVRLEAQTTRCKAIADASRPSDRAARGHRRDISAALLQDDMHFLYTLIFLVLLAVG